MRNPEHDAILIIIIVMLGVSPKRGVIEPNQEQIVQVKLSSKLFDFGKPSAPYAIQVNMD